jgi:DNA-binding PadR family transcriptional regulator
MYPDHSLMPKEAVHLAALGILAEGARTYADLASEVRDFTSHIMGPNLDIMGTSIQLLSFEGLIAAETAGEPGRVLPPDTLLTITEAGRAELETLMLASVRSPFNDLNKLVVALKMRLLHLLDDDQRRTQAEIITTALRGELARLASLREKRLTEATGDDALVRWLDHDLAQIEDSLRWFAALAPGGAE